MQLLARRPITFFAIFISLLFVSDNSWACLQSERFSKRLLEANVIFEGSLTHYELHQIDTTKINDSNIIVGVYKIDRNWKGAKKGEEVRVYQPQYVSIGPYKLDKVPKPPNLPYKGIILLSGKTVSTIPKTENLIYTGNMCPAELWDVSFNHRLAIVLSLFISIFR